MTPEKAAELQREAVRLALRGSVEKWDRIIDGKSDDMGTSNCPLCRKFHSRYNHKNECEGCPVHTKTGLTNCEGTPYPKFREHVVKKHGKRAWMRVHCDECKKIAGEMKSFLKSLDF